MWAGNVSLILGKIFKVCFMTISEISTKMLLNLFATKFEHKLKNKNFSENRFLANSVTAKEITLSNFSAIFYIV